MDPLTVGTAVVAGEAMAAGTATVAGETMAAETIVAQGLLEAESGILGLEAGLETAAEASESIISEQGLVDQLDSIRFESMEALAARNEAAINGLSQIEANELSQIEANRIAGAAREEAVSSELVHEYPAENGSHIERECYLRDAEGHVVKDPETGEARRVDFAVTKDGEVVKSVEVTSETADKTVQLAKEARIREAGGNYIKDRSTGELARFPSDVKTEVWRRA